MSPLSGLQILVVDDDEGHAELVRRNLRRSGFTAPITSVTRGEDAIDYVFRRNGWRDRASGGALVLLLDVKMPGRVDGIEVLHRIKGDARTRRIPVIMLTTTDDPRDVERCYGLGCNAYVTKPVEPGAFAESVRRLGEFLPVVVVPPEPEAVS